MKRRLLYIPKVQTFTSDETGEVISGGKIAVCMPESHADNNGIGMFTEIFWVGSELINKLTRSVTADKLPCLIDVIVEQKSIKGRSTIVDIEVLNEK